MECPMLVTMLLLMLCVAGVASRNCSASELLESLDRSVHPCEDFHQYACGGWLAHHFLEQGSHQWQSLQRITPHSATRNMLAERHKPSDLNAVKKAKNLYASCVNHTPGPTEDAAIVRAVTDRFGRWPLTCKDCKVTGFDLETFLSKAIRIGVHPLFKLEANYYGVLRQDGQRNGTRHIHIERPVLGIYTEITNPIHRQIYADTIYANAKRFGIDDDERAKQDAMDIVQVQNTLLTLYDTPSWHAPARFHTLESLDENYGQLMNWTNFVLALASSPDIGITDLSVNDSVYVYAPHYLSNMTTYFTQLPVRMQVNYIIWRVVHSLETELTYEEHAVNDTEDEEFRDSQCSYYAARSFSLVVHRLLYNDHLPQEKLQTVKAMIKRLREEFYVIVNEHDWLDENTTNAIEEKVDNILVTIAYFENAMDSSFLERYYSNITIDQGNFINNFIDVRKDAFAKNFRTIRTITRLETSSLPQLFVGQYYSSFNTIEFTSVLLQSPWYIDDAPMSLNYAAFGFLLSHELLHSFDTNGRHYDKNGIHRVWWDDKSITNFENRTKCLVDQYNKYFYKSAGVFVNGEHTLGENIADNGGIKLVHRVYRDYIRSRNHTEPRLPGVQFSNEQVFFLRYAQLWCMAETKLGANYAMDDVHSPGEFRIVGPLQNSEAFARSFNCPVGSRMNPVKKCEVW